MHTTNVAVPLEGNESVSGVITMPDESTAPNRTGIILAHGAANDMHNALIVYLAHGLADKGFINLRFNFLYKERGRNTPDAQKKLEHTWQQVYHFFKDQCGHQLDTIIAAGKSMGGRVASQMVSENQLPVSRLVFLGYPLHPPGKKHQLRDAHLYQIDIPMFFFAGSRDPFCDLALLEDVTGKLSAVWSVDIIKDGNHSFQIPKATDTEQQAIYAHILNTMAKWIDTDLPGK
ncbi:MAG: dienelactone hydrolase family protein [Desulfobacterales bacterium]|nr:dienelactone hydrolase family protein [Desulfobacterales bacterium]